MFKQARWMLIIFILSLFLAHPGIAKADGVIVYPPDSQVWEADQKAALFYTTETQTEDLVLSVKFEGGAGDFGWLIPTPNKPVVEKISDTFFSRMAKVSQTKKNLLEKLKGDSPAAIEFFGLGKNASLGDTSSNYVEVWSEKQVGILDIAVLSADNSGALLDWLNENGYQLPSAYTYQQDYYYEYDQQTTGSANYGQDSKPILNGNQQPETLAMIQNYIDEDWYFIAIKVNGLYLGSTSGSETYDPYYQYNQGQIDPIRITFTTPQPVYPLKISGLAQRDANILLYIVSDSRMEIANFASSSSGDKMTGLVKPALASIFPMPIPETTYNSFQTQYANWISAEDISEAVRDSFAEKSWFEPKDKVFMTKLYAAYLPYSSMNADLLFQKASNNKTVLAGEMTFTNWLVLPFYGMVYGPTRAIESFIGLFNTNQSSATTTLFFIVPLVFCLFFLFSMVWVAVSFMFLRRSRKIIIRIIFSFLELVGLWLLVTTIVAFLVIPYVIILALVGTGTDVAFVNLAIFITFHLVFLTLASYKILQFIDKKLGTAKKQVEIEKPARPEEK